MENFELEKLIGKPQSANVKLDGSDNAHISKVEVFTGPDDYEETHRMMLKSIGDKLIITQSDDKTFGCAYRPRNEPGIRIFIDTEGVDEFGNYQTYVLQFCHHKGSVYIDCEKFTVNEKEPDKAIQTEIKNNKQ